MTNEEKSRIVKMRGDGIGYKKIAQTLGLSEGTVKTFCHRNGLAGAGLDAPEKVSASISQKPCRHCGAMVVQIPGRKEKKFCSDECRNSWWNRHLSETKRKNMMEYVCPACGKTFSAYGKRNRKYCSHECYITDRFGGVACR